MKTLLYVPNQLKTNQVQSFIETITLKGSTQVCTSYDDLVKTLRQPSIERLVTLLGDQRVKVTTTPGGWQIMPLITFIEKEEATYVNCTC